MSAAMIAELPTHIGPRLLTDETGCWLWQGALSANGYGHVRVGHMAQGVHRVVYELLVGPVPEGLELDHLCRVRRCANPAHLEAVTHSENVRRGTAWHVIAEAQRSKTHCRRGHPFAGRNVRYRRDGARVCRTCARENQARYVRRMRAA